MSVLETPELTLLGNYLNLTAFRQQLVASNLANVDTPGYRTVDINFRSELARALAQPAGTALNPQVYDVAGLAQRPDGNNVSVDRESMLLGETQLEYQTGVELWRAEMSNLIAAVSEGSRT
ncbi:MAG: flagellar biosynthesis protein FlgB [Acidobacteriota bacterium]|nr:flagellar biosynthesis protein FlgB [Acidobacteriota bacterium]